MPPEPHIDRARTRVETERDAVAAKYDAIERFVDRVADLPTASVPPSSGVMATTNTLPRDAPATTDRCRTVQRTFAETIRPHSVDDVDDPESLSTTVRTEFTDSIAVALAPTAETSFSPTLKRAIVREATARRTGTGALLRALDREETHLDAAGEAVDGITAWIVEADGTPLAALGFDALRRRHGTLATHLDRCEDLARERQAFLREITSESAEAAIPHRRLVPSRYRDFSVDHPLLATAARLAATCGECQRVVRTHLVRRA